MSTLPPEQMTARVAPGIVPGVTRPWRCPVCSGRGFVPADFYQGIGYVTNTASQQCRSCGGRGIVFS